MSVEIDTYIVFCVYRRSYSLWSPVVGETETEGSPRFWGGDGAEKNIFSPLSSLGFVFSDLPGGSRPSGVLPGSAFFIVRVVDFFFPMTQLNKKEGKFTSRLSSLANAIDAKRERLVHKFYETRLC